MIHHLSGRLIEKNPTHLVIECGGVGYFVNISLYSFERLPEGENCRVFTYLSIKEDAHSLYGFTSQAERDLFTLLISVSGVGTNTARLILSALTPGEVRAAISMENEALLTRIKGLGPKTAKRLILELKDKVMRLDSGTDNFENRGNTIKNEALSGLLVLGFEKKKAEGAIEAVYSKQPDLAVEELIKAAIKTLY